MGKKKRLLLRVCRSEQITAKTPGARSLTASVPDAFGGLGTALGAELGLASAVSGTSLAKAEIGDCYFYPRRDAAQPVPTTRNVSDEASKPEPMTQEFRYLTYYDYSELPPAEKPADIVLSSFRIPRSERRSRRLGARPTLLVWIPTS
jgi:hypothetical protein